jgi:hypothetical protein
MNIKEKLIDALEKTEKELENPMSHEEYAILLLTKSNILLGLQKYENE